MGNETRNIFITGSATRVGAVIGRRLVHAGRCQASVSSVKIILHYNSRAAAAEKLADELHGQGVEVTLWQQDLRAPDLATQFQNLMKQAGPVDTLINNAAVFYPNQDNAHGMTPELKDEIMTVNYHAPVVLMQEMAAALPSGRAGNIINILDQRVLNPSHAFPVYTESKLALWRATKEMAVRFAPNIRVNAIAPGHVLPNVGEDEEKFHARQAKTPLGIGPAPEDIAAAVEFILNSPSMTGALIPLDGGEHLVLKAK